MHTANTSLTNLSATSTHGTYRVREDGRILLEGTVPEQTTITLEAGILPGRIHALMLETVPDDTLPNHGPGTGDGGNFVLSHIGVALIGKDGKTETPLEISGAEASIEQQGFPVTNSLKTAKDARKDGSRGWAIAGGTGMAQTAIFYLNSTLEVSTGAGFVLHWNVKM